MSHEVNGRGHRIRPGAQAAQTRDNSGLQQLIDEAALAVDLQPSQLRDYVRLLLTDVRDRARGSRGEEDQQHTKGMFKAHVLESLGMGRMT